MPLQLIEYIPDKTKPEEKARAVDVESLLDTMSELEEYTGTTQEKVHDIYYEIKRQLRQATAEEPEKEKK